jgi:hypothetical protein
MYLYHDDATYVSYIYMYHIYDVCTSYMDLLSNVTIWSTFRCTCIMHDYKDASPNII